jgi:hypothetical protein
MNHFKITLIQLSLLMMSHLHAGELKSFTLKPGVIKIEVPRGWQEARDLFGIQLTLLGPDNGTNRPVITIDSTQFSEFKFDTESLKKDKESYQNGRKKWLAKNDGSLKEFFPYSTVKLMSGKVEDHVLGYRYIFGGNEFVEYSHFIKCKKNLYHFKVLLLSREKLKYETEIEILFKNFSCNE